MDTLCCSRHSGFYRVIHHHPGPSRKRPRDYQTFLAALEAAFLRHPVRLVAYSVLPHDAHLIVGPVDPKGLHQWLRRVVSTLADPLAGPSDSRVTAASRPSPTRIHRLRTTADLVFMAQNVERCALSAGFVRRAQDWPWSSLSERLRPGTRLPLVSTPFLSSSLWIDYVNLPLRPVDHLTQHPRRLASRLQTSQDAVHISRPTDKDQADPHVEGPEHLVLLHGA